MMKLQFLGGAQTVTGSKTLTQFGEHRVLVDCGLFQGLKDLRLKNRDPLPVDPHQIDAVLLTHAHLDHSGYLPLLVREGFRGKIYCSTPTRELARLILHDSAKLLEEDAEYANKRGFSKHHPAAPLYTQADVTQALEYFQPVPPGKWHPLDGGAQFRLSGSGHILGSTFVEVEAEGKHLVFSGDLGRAHPLLYEPPTRIENADYLILESTYGDRNHLESIHEEPAAAKLARIVRETHQRGGQLIIPSFAVGRVQDLLFLLSVMKKEGKIPNLPIYLDSPMGVNATQIFTDFPDWHRLDRSSVDQLCRETQVIESRVESIRVMREAAPAVIIAGSGMIEGGRVLHHLTARLPDERCTVLLVGFQAAGTRGRLLRDGAEELKIHGRYIPVKCHVEELAGLSAHADQSETLEWLHGFRKAPEKVFINHGEPQAADALRVKLGHALGWKCVVPSLNQEYSLGHSGISTGQSATRGKFVEPEAKSA